MDDLDAVAAASGGIAVTVPARATASGGWRTQLNTEARDSNITMIFKTLKKHLPILDPDLPRKLRAIAERCEDKICLSSTNQANYERGISRAILKIENTKRRHHRADDYHASAMQLTIQIQQSQSNTLHPNNVRQHRHPQTGCETDQLPMQQTQQTQPNLHENQLICRENSVVQLQQREQALAQANNLLIMQQAMCLQPQHPCYGDASVVPQVNTDSFNNHGFALHSSPSATNLCITGGTLASDAGKPICALYSSPKDAQLVYYGDNVDREHVIGIEHTVITQPSEETDNRPLLEHGTYAALFIEDYNMEHWNREHITSTAAQITKQHTADPICIYGIGYSAVLITVKTDFIFSLSYKVPFKNHDGLSSRRSVKVVPTENNDDSDDVTNSEQVEQSNGSRPLVDPNQPGPSSDPGAMQIIGLQPVQRGQVLHRPAVHGHPITSKPKVLVKMHDGYFKVSAQGRGGESCKFRIPMKPLMAMGEGSAGLLMANIRTASVGVITEIRTTGPNRHLTVTAHILAQSESIRAKREDTKPELQLLTDPKMRPGTGDKFELPGPSASDDPIYSDLENINIETSSPSPSCTAFSDDKQNPTATSGHLDVDESWPELPPEQRIQDEKGRATIDFDKDIPPHHPKHSPYDKSPTSPQLIDEVDLSFDYNQLLNLDDIQDPPASDETQMEDIIDEEPQQPGCQAKNMPSLQELPEAVPDVPNTKHLSSPTNTGNAEHQQTSLASHTPSFTTTPGISVPPRLLAEFTRADNGSQANNVPTQVPTKISAPQRPTDRLLKAIRAIPQEHLSGVLSDMRSVFSMAWSTPCNGFRPALGEDLVDVSNPYLPTNFIKYDQTGTSINTKRTNYCPELQSTTISHVKRQKVSGGSSLMQEIEDINRSLIDTEIHVCQDDAELLPASTSEGPEGTAVKFTFTAVAVGPSMKSMFATGKLSPISLRLRVPATYPKCSPVILDKFPDEQRSSDDLNTKAMSKLSTLVRDLVEPISLEQMAKTWNDCVRGVIVEYAQQTGGGSFTSTYGRWEGCGPA